MGMAPGYRLEKTAQAGKTADAAEDVKHRDGGREEAGVERRGAAVRGDAVERVLEEEVRREFSGLPVYVGMGGYAKRTAPMDERQFRRYLETCRRFGFRFDRRGRGGSSRWRSCSHLQRYKPASNSTQTPQAGHPSWTGWRRR
jgi:hypothetical protein